MDLICYLHEGWKPYIRPAPAQRPWMDATPGSYAYRCLPLNIANAHGWEVLSPIAFEAIWTGGSDPACVRVRPAPGSPPHLVPQPLFGSGILTFHVEGLFRTPPGWNLWVGGSPNRIKDGIQALSGVIETDWAPYTFTMNWRFTRPHNRVRFEAGEPIAFFFPVQRGVVESVEPVFVPMADAPQEQAAFTAWKAARDNFQRQVAVEPPKTSAEQWQKHYYRGVLPDETPGPPDHQTRLRPKPFAADPHQGAAPLGAPAPARRPPKRR